VRDEVMLRDEMQCTFVGAEGRCPEKEGLHLDHAEPHALGGSDDAANLRERCAGHNLLEAERIFGVEFMRSRREANRSRSGTDEHSRSGTDEHSRSGTDERARSGPDG
jgi:5-methylcytosine-specific restriction endonuclease McrA